MAYKPVPEEMFRNKAYDHVQRHVVEATRLINTKGAVEDVDEQMAKLEDAMQNYEKAYQAYIQTIEGPQFNAEQDANKELLHQVGKLREATHAYLQAPLDTSSPTHGQVIEVGKRASKAYSAVTSHLGVVQSLITKHAPQSEVQQAARDLGTAHQQYVTINGEYITYLQGDDIAKNQAIADDISSQVSRAKILVHNYTEPARNGSQVNSPPASIYSATSSQRAREQELAIKMAKIKAQQDALARKQQVEEEEAALKATHEAELARITKEKQEAQRRLQQRKEREALLAQEEELAAEFQTIQQQWEQDVHHTGSVQGQETQQLGAKSVVDHRSPSRTPPPIDIDTPALAEGIYGSSSKGYQYNTPPVQKTSPKPILKSTAGSPMVQRRSLLEPETQQERSRVPQHTGRNLSRSRQLYDRSPSRGDQSTDPMSQMLALLAAPKLELPIFSGDPLQYHKFTRSFKINVESMIKDYEARLARLIQSCEGKARDLIEGCIMMPGEQGYLQAKALLEAHYGDPYIIVRAWVDKLASGGTARDAASLETLAINARACYDTLSATNSMKEIDNYTNLQRIIERLPNHAQHRWRSESVKVRRQGRAPDFKDLLHLIENIADEYNEPSLRQSTPKEGYRKQKGHKSSSFTTATTP